MRPGIRAMALAAAAILIGLAGHAGAAAPPIKIALVGDSTVAPDGGWGPAFAKRLGPGAECVNLARGGRSSKSFRDEGHWKSVLEQRPDYVLIQFGHNDMPGKGPERETDPETTYAANMARYVDEARAIGARPILVTSVTRRRFTPEGRIRSDLAPYVDAVKRVAAEKNVPLVDLHARSIAQLDALGPQAAAAFDRPPRPGDDPSKPDRTHLSDRGGEATAQLVAEELKRVAPELGRLLIDDRPPTLFLIGDSTVRIGRGDGANGQWGWGEPLAAFFDPAKIRVENRARGGRSSRTFINEGLWDAVHKELRPGDFVLMQFGHNDSVPLEDRERPRGSIPSTGEETREIENPATHQPEIVRTYGWYLRRIIADTKAKAATPIVLSPVPRKRWTAENKIVRNLDNYTTLSREVARAQGVPFVDLNAIIADRYDRLGRAGVEPLFQGDGTHTSAAGAEINAAAVIAGLKGLPDAPLTRYLSPKGDGVAAYTAGERSSRLSPFPRG